jgi:hypothetical protein
VLGGLILFVAAGAGGTIATYLFDPRAPGYGRLAMGAIIGLTVLSFAGFVAAMLVGMGGVVLVVAGAVALLPAVALVGGLRRRVAADLATARRTAGTAIEATFRDRAAAVGAGWRALYVGGLGLITWLLADSNLLERPDGLYITNVNNLGDLPYHSAIATSFAFGGNFPPQNPVFSGGGFSYHYIADFLAALPLAAGASLRDSFFLVSFVLLAALIAVIHRWARDITGSAIAARLTPVIVLCSGGFGWLQLLDQARTGEHGIVAAFLSSDARYTIDNDGVYRFGNVVTTMLMPQRGFLLGFGLAVVILTLLWHHLAAARLATHPGAAGAGGGRQEAPVRVAAGASGGGDLTLARRRMIAAGLLTGLLPLVHLHGFAVVLGTAFLLGVVFREWRDGRWRLWVVYLGALALTAVPTLLWTARDSQASLASFVALELGWDHGEQPIPAFWVTNAGAFIALLVAAYAWPWERRLLPRRLLLYSIPFLGWFLLPNVLRLAPWIWDNIKVLIFWWLGGAPLVALLIARIWRSAGAVGRIVAPMLLGVVVLAGALDIARATIGPRTYREYDRDGVAFAAAVRDATPPRSVILADPTYNTPILLTGRLLFMGYPGWLFSNGLNSAQREADVRAMFAGDAGAEDLIRRNGIRYIVLGPQERTDAKANEAFLARFPTVVQVGEYRLLEVPPA